MSGRSPLTDSCAREAGFTLVEALVSLAVFSLIAAGCVTMLMQTVGAQRAIAESQASLRELQTARALLSADALQIVLRSTRGQDGVRSTAFAGRESAPNALEFVRGSASAPYQGFGRVKLQAIAYRFVDGGLVRLSRDELDAGTDGWTSQRMLFRRIKNGRFEYFDGVEWRREWLTAGSGGSLPRAIALIGDVERYGEIRIEVLVEPVT